MLADPPKIDGLASPDDTDPLVRFADMLASRSRIEELIAALIDVLDITDAPLEDVDTEDLVAIGHHPERGAGDEDDAEASDGLEGFTWRADGLDRCNVIAIGRCAARRGA
jgi:hypothetical protein